MKGGEIQNTYFYTPFLTLDTSHPRFLVRAYNFFDGGWIRHDGSWIVRMVGSETTINRGTDTDEKPFPLNFESGPSRTWRLGDNAMRHAGRTWERSITKSRLLYMMMYGISCQRS